MLGCRYYEIYMRGKLLILLLGKQFGNTMSAVVSFKVSRDVKEKMKKYKQAVNWSEELRRFVEEKIRNLEAEENLRRVVEELERASWSVPYGFSSSSVREDRDSR